MKPTAVIENDGLFVFSVFVVGAAVLISLNNHKKTSGNDIFDRVGNENNVPSNLLRALHVVENPKNLNAPNLNDNGTHDWGTMQVNEDTFIHYDVPKDLWLDEYTNVTIAARYLNDTKQELGELWSIFSWISAYNQGVPNFKKHGITNVSYVGQVYYHYTMFELANNA